jgi:hypothetical protein
MKSPKVALVCASNPPAGVRSKYALIPISGLADCSLMLCDLVEDDVELTAKSDGQDHSQSASFTRTY